MTNDPLEPFKDLFDDAKILEKEQRTAARYAKKEPTMRALRRILGDGVLAIFPPDLMTSVDKAFRHWQEHPDSFLVTPFDTEQERDDTLLVLRAYAECAGEDGYTVYTEAAPEANVLHWRVQTRKGTKNTG